MHIFGEKTLIFVQILCRYEEMRLCCMHIYIHSAACSL